MDFNLISDMVERACCGGGQGLTTVAHPQSNKTYVNKVFKLCACLCNTIQCALWVEKG